MAGVGEMPWPKTGGNSLPCTARTSKTKVVQSKVWLSIGRMDDLHRNYKTRSMFEGAWKGLEPEATPSPQSSSL